MKLIFFILFFLPFPALSQSVKLTWNASPSVGVTNYVLHGGTNDFVLVTVSCGTNLVCTLTNIVAGQWRFYCTAQKDGVESGPSNILLFEVPRAPENLRTIAVQYSFTLGTNWHDALYFKFAFP